MSSTKVEDLNKSELNEKRKKDRQYRRTYVAKQEEITELKQDFLDLVSTVGIERALRTEWQSFLAHLCFQMYLFTRGNHEPVRFIFPSDGSPVTIHITKENFAEHARLLSDWEKYYQPEEDDWTFAQCLHLLPPWVSGTEVCSLDQLKIFRKRAVELGVGVNTTATVDRGTFERYFLKILESFDRAEQHNDPKLALRFPVPIEPNAAYEEWRKSYLDRLQGKPAEPAKLTAAEIVKPRATPRICFVGASTTPVQLVSDVNKDVCLVRYLDGDRWVHQKVSRAAIRFADEVIKTGEADKSLIDRSVDGLYGN